MTAMRRDQQILLLREVRDAEDDARRQRQLGVEARVEIAERRHDAQHDDADQADREQR